MLAREAPDGLMLGDGHLRVETMGEQPIPVLVLDINENEADVLLAAYEPISAMAKTDQEALDALLASIITDSEALQEMLEGMKSSEPNEVELPPATYEIIVECDSEQQQQELFDRLSGEGHRVRVLTF